MEITPVTPRVRTTKVRTIKTVVPKSSKATPPPAVAKPKVAAEPRKRKTLTKRSGAEKSTVVAATHGDLAHMIATAAYFLAEGRHFAPGYELQDWIAAEQSILGSRLGT